MASFEKLESTFSPDVQVRGKQFEKLLKWWLQSDPVYSARLKKVWLWDEWPGRDGADIGIDLVAEAHDGGIWAIQAKCIDPKNSLKKSEVDSFLAASSKSPFTFQLLITSTGNLSANLLRAFSGRPAALATRAELASSEVDWPLSINDLATGKPKEPREPREHQEAAIADVLAGFEDSRRGQLIMACGTGKTLTALFIAKETEAKRILVLLPSLSLLSQTLREWASSDFKFEFLPVCSDETVSTPDAALGSVSELGFPVTTDPEAIATFLKRRSGNRVVFATYQSSPRIAAAFAGGGIPKFDLVIADEAHRCAGRVSSDYGTVLDEGLIPSKKLLFMTATPRYFTGRVIKEAKESDFEVASMDDHQVFGPVFHTLSFSDAIDKKLLTDYQVVIVGVDDDTYLEWVNEGQFVTIDGTKVTDARSLAAQIGLLKAMKKAKEFASSMPEVLAWMPKSQRPKGSLISDFVSGEMPTGSRKVKLDRLATIEPSERALLANARCLTEGVDVPTLDGVAFVDPRSSEVDIVQAVGRAIRLSDDKKIGTIVLPIFIPNSQDPSVSLDDPSFQSIWKVIDALRSHDTKLGESLDEIRRGMGSGNSSEQFPKKIQFDLPSRVDASFATAFEAQIVTKTTSNWEFMIGLLEHFVRREGNSRVPSGHLENGLALGAWVGTQRYTFGTGSLADDRVARLEGLPGWSWDTRADRWELAYSSLEEFVRREGDARVPTNHSENGFDLGTWVTNQRTNFSRGKLFPERVARLEALPGWSWNTFDDRWDEVFSMLNQFIEREGHAQVPVRHLENGFALGAWVANQRTKYVNDSLGRELTERLEGLSGWAWKPFDNAWEDAYGLLERFVAREGTAAVPKNHYEGDLNLGNWVANQRSIFAKGGLPADRISRLENVSGWFWSSKDRRWEQGFTLLERYVLREGNARITTNHIEQGVRLGSWVGTQRRQYKNGTLSSDRVTRLESLVLWTWDTLDSRWDEAFEILCSYVEREGSALVPQRHIEGGFFLGAWVANQRNSFKGGILSADRAGRLANLTGWLWETRSSEWDRKFSLLETFVIHQRNAHVPTGVLATWVSKQRRDFKNGILPPDQVARLETLPGWKWNPNDDAWERAFSLLEEFVTREENANVPTDHVEAGFDLGPWVSRQRRVFAKEKLSSDRVARFQALPGWSWDVLDSRWDEAFGILVAYVDRVGSSRVHLRHVEDGFALGNWVSSQRVNFRTGKLSADRGARLQVLPGWSWDRFGEKWEYAYSLLEEFAMRQGDAVVPHKHQEGGFALGQWVGVQRRKFRAGKLSPEQVARLEKVPGWKWA
jgi:superfamily II DNA or RNA helicase